VLAAVLAALAVCVALAAAAVYLRSQHHSAAAPNSAPGEPQTGHHPPTAATAGGGGLGVPTVVSGCPAAAVPGARARCPAVAECWGGLVVISGAATAEPLPCAVPHTWQTFAIAPLPADAQTFDQPTLEANPTVRAVCSIQVLLRSRRGQASRTPPGEWQADVLPPTETAYGGGSRTYRCVAARIGDQPAQSAFGP
jgi:hypothetical protein